MPRSSLNREASAASIHRLGFVVSHSESGFFVILLSSFKGCVTISELSRDTKPNSHGAHGNKGCGDFEK
jgi:hypothetical protein